MQLASKALVNIMRNWNGVIYMASAPLGLSSMVKSLTQPIRNYKKIAIIDTFIDIFDIPIYIAGSDIGGGQIGSTASTSNGSNQVVNFNENLLNNYVALLLQAFNYCGIYDALINLGTTTDE